MTSRSKPRLWITAAATAILVIACYKVQQFVPGKETQDCRTSEAALSSAVPFFNKQVGRLVKKDTTQQWIDEYNRIFHTPNRYMLHADALTSLLANKNCVGLILYNGLAGSSWVVLPYGLRSDGSVIKTASVALQNGAVDWHAAEAYREAYRQHFPNATEGHFFGSDVFFRLMTDMGAATILFQRGMNEKGEQLIMRNGSVNNSSGANEYDIDASHPCPPYCP